MPFPSAPPHITQGSRVLVVDNYDSFVYTLVSYIHELGVDTQVIRNDDINAADLGEFLTGFAGVLLSPGPGTPDKSGVCPAIIRYAAQLSQNAGSYENVPELPVFGVCLGHQALGEVFGATVTHSPQLMHGKTSLVHHTGTGIFSGCRTPLRATRYHSLAIVDETLDSHIFEVTAHTDDGIIMAIRHRQAPLYGVQFHPESVLTEDGYMMLGNFLAVCGFPEAAQLATGRSPLASAVTE